MKLQLKEDPREWRKQAWLAAVGLAVLSCVLRWRRVLPQHLWLGALAVFAGVFLCAWIRPGWFRGYYRLSMRLGFAASRVLGFVALVLFFLCVLTPVGLILRLAGKDPLQLKRAAEVTSYWQKTSDGSSLDRLF
jgi:hypothetical protein